MEKNDAPGNRVAILGLGKTGYQSALYLKSKGFEVFISESNQTPSALQYQKELQEKGFEVEVGTHTLERFNAVDWVLVSPGIPPFSDILQTLFKKKIPVFSEIEVASWFSPTSNIIAVTGTSGKTTVTTLLSRILQKQLGEDRVVLCGNIGNPWMGELESLDSDSWVVLEVSSFQLAYCERFRPHIGVLLNLSPNHLDWHETMNHYVASKLKLFQAQVASDYAIMQRDDCQEFFADHSFQANQLFFDHQQKGNPNEEAIWEVARICECPDETVEDVLENFTGLEHRLERLGQIKGVEFINDSKSTTPASLKWALESFEDQQVILIAGGKPKSKNFESLASVLQKKAKMVVVMGEAKDELRKVWSSSCTIQEADNLEQAVQLAAQSAVSGNVILLSPACASFDMFKNYEDRGQQFKEIVKKLSEATGTHV